MYPYASPALPPVYNTAAKRFAPALAPNLTATASVAQSIERRSRVKFAAGGLEVAFFATGPV